MRTKDFVISEEVLTDYIARLRNLHEPPSTQSDYNDAIVANLLQRARWIVDDVFAPGFSFRSTELVGSVLCALQKQEFKTDHD